MRTMTPVPIPALTAPLAWFPLDADQWISRTALLSLEATGALLVCVLCSWNAAVRGDEPGTLPASEPALARLLGPTWRKVLGTVREHFTEDPDTPGRLRCAWVADLYAAQLARHTSAVERGKKGGWKQGRPRPKRNTSAIAQLSPSSTEVERDPVGGSFGAPTTGGVVAAVGRGGATSTPPPDPGPVTVAHVNAWVESCPAVRREAEQEVDTLLDADNEGWRQRPAGAGIRNRLVEAKLADQFLRARRRGTTTALGALLSPHHPSRGSLPGAAPA